MNGSTGSEGAQLTRFERQLLGILRNIEDTDHARRRSLACSADEDRDIGSRVETGATCGHSVVDTNGQIEAHIGIDLGTTCTKIVAGFPYEAGSPSFAIPAPPTLQAEGHPYLWLSALWIDRSGRFDLLPHDDFEILTGFKLGLMLGAHPNSAGMISAVRPAEIACAYIALQLRQAKGWLLTHHPGVFARPGIAWYCNLGFPAASLNDPILGSRYSQCFAAALLLQLRPWPITAETVRTALTVVENRHQQALTALRGGIAPEIAAAVAGFAYSMRLDDGLFAMVDVGGITVDCCTFNLFKDREDQARCPVLQADVQPLGVEVWECGKTYAGFADEFRKALDLQLRGFIWSTRTRRAPLSCRWAEGLPLFFSGGGMQSSAHVQALEELDRNLFRHPQTALAPMRRLELEPPQNLDHGQCDASSVHRLYVAIGLGRPHSEIPIWKPPRDIDDVEPQTHVDIEGRYISAEQM